MLHPTVYSLSRKYGPPEIDLRKAEIMDSNGAENNAARPINHHAPEDVSRNDFDYYHWVFAFMGFRDLLFYLYPIALEYERDKGLECVDSYMYSLNRFMPEEFAQLSAEDQQGVVDGLQWIWDTAPLGYADWVRCHNLKAAIGKSVTWEDIAY